MREAKLEILAQEAQLYTDCVSKLAAAKYTDPFTEQTVCGYGELRSCPFQGDPLKSNRSYEFLCLFDGYTNQTIQR